MSESETDDFVRDRCIIALIGPLGSGKRTLAARVADLYKDTHAEQLTLLPMSTTRKIITSRPNDGRFFQHMASWRFTALSVTGKMIDGIDHLGERYGYDRDLLEETLQTKDVIAPMRANAIVAMRQLGYTIYAVRVIAQDRHGEPRIASDKDPLIRACSLRADMTIINVFDHKGLTMAVDHLAYLVTLWTGHERPRAGDSFSL